MLISFLVYSIYNMVIAARDNWCSFDPAPGSQHNQFCGSAWKFYFSEANKSGFDLDMIERGLYVLNWFLLLGLKAYYIRVMVKLGHKLDENLTEITDYTVEVRGLPMNTNALDIMHFFEGKMLTSFELSHTIQVHPAGINYVFSDTNMLNRLDTDVRRSLKKYGMYKVQMLELEEVEQKEKFENRVVDMEKMIDLRYTMPLAPFDNINHPGLNFAGKGYLSFNTMVERNAVLENLQITGIPKFFYKYFGFVPETFSGFEWGNNQKLNDNVSFYILPPKNPADIIWENQGISAISHTLRRLLSAVISILIICLSFAAAVGIKRWQTQVKSNWLASIMLTIALQIFNAVFVQATFFMINFEKPETRTTYHTLSFWRMSLV